MQSMEKEKEKQRDREAGEACKRTEKEQVDRCKKSRYPGNLARLRRPTRVRCRSVTPATNRFEINPPGSATCPPVVCVVGT